MDSRWTSPSEALTLLLVSTEISNPSWLLLGFFLTVATGCLFQSRFIFVIRKNLILEMKIKRTIFEVESNPYSITIRLMQHREKNREMKKKQNQNPSEILPFRCF